MNAPHLAALTWDHPRGYGPPAALDAVDRGGANPWNVTAVPAPITWEKQPLEGFESTDLASLAATYDAIIIDHPHIADAVRDHAIVPLSSLFSDAELQAWSTRFAGQSYQSYSYRGQQWALPVDAATQVMAARPHTPELGTWEAVAEHARTARVLLCLAGPHALSTLISILVSQGHHPADGAELAPEADLIDGLEFLRALRRSSIDGVDHLNPIQALSHMVDDPSISVIPLVYGYVNFTADGIDFREAPAWTLHGRRGAVLGGTGIAVTPRGQRSPILREHIRRMVDPYVQATLIPASGGQPAALSAWVAPEVNAAAHGFYTQTQLTMRDSWVRPRRPGWLAFYNAASAVVRDVATGSASIQDGAQLLLSGYRQLSPTPT